MSGKQKECGYSWTSEGEIHTCSLHEGHMAAHICGFVFNPSDCCLERAEPTPPEGEAVRPSELSALHFNKIREGVYEAKDIMHKVDAARLSEIAENFGKRVAAPVVSTAAPGPEHGINNQTLDTRVVARLNKALHEAKAVAPESYKPAEGPEISELIAQQGIKPMKTGHELEIPGLSDEDMEGFPAATPVTVEAPLLNKDSFLSPLTQAACAISQLSNDSYRKKQIVSIAEAERIIKGYGLANPAQPPCSECATLSDKWYMEYQAAVARAVQAEDECATLRKERDDAQSELFLSGVELTKQRSLAIVARLNAALWQGKLQAAEAQLSTLRDALERPPDGYAFRYPDNCIRFNEGYSINGCDPIAQIPYWFEPLKVRAALAPTPEVAPKACQIKGCVNKVAEMRHCIEHMPGNFPPETVAKE